MKRIGRWGAWTAEQGGTEAGNVLDYPAEGKGAAAPGRSSHGPGKGPAEIRPAGANVMILL